TGGAATAGAPGRHPGRPRLRPAPPGSGHQLRLRSAGKPTPGARTDQGGGSDVPGGAENSTSASGGARPTATSAATQAQRRPAPAPPAAAADPPYPGAAPALRLQRSGGSCGQPPESRRAMPDPVGATVP